MSLKLTKLIARWLLIKVIPFSPMTSYKVLNSLELFMRPARYKIFNIPLVHAKNSPLKLELDIFKIIGNISFVQESKRAGKFNNTFIDLCIGK